MWNRLRFIRFLQVSQIFQRRKSDTNKQDFENKLNLTCHAQSTPKTTGFLTKVFSTSGPNLVALAWTVDELSREQAQNGVNFYFEVKFDLEGQGQSPPKTIRILTKVFYTYGPNLVILAWTGDELSRGQTWWRTDWRTDGLTDAGNDNTRRPILASGKKVTIRSINVRRQRPKYAAQLRDAAQNNDQWRALSMRRLSAFSIVELTMSPRPWTLI